MFNKEYRLLSFVPRWGIAPRLTQQSVAEHCFYVALYSSQLCDRMSDLPPAYKNIIVGYALRHDAYEVWTSDMPGPGKRYILDERKMDEYIGMFAKIVPDYRDYRRLATGVKIEELASRIIKTADLLDEVFYLTMEFHMGNTLVENVLVHSRKRLWAKLSESADDFSLKKTVEFELQRLVEEGARIPAMDVPLNPV